MRLLRVLNAAGLESFSAFLRDPGSAEAELPKNLLEDEAYSQPAPVTIRVPVESFSSKFELARALDAAIDPGFRSHLAQNVGAWSWLALLYLDQLAPRKSGTRHFGAEYRFILSPDYRHFYRHLVAGPFYIYQNHREYSRALLAPAVHKHGDFAEQLGSRTELITNAAVVAALDHLYFDSQAERPKRGATNRKRGGTLRRYITVLQQLERTYDLYGMSAQELLAVLPREFEPWRSAS